LGRFAGAVRSAFGLAVDVALPQLCACCREPVAAEGLCAPCWSKLAFIAPPYCERLGIPFPYDPGPGVLSMEAIADPPAYRRARAAVCYGDVAATLVHALKYGDRLDLAPIMARWMTHAGQELLAEADAIVPVPLHWRRQWARRFNQAALLCELIGTGSGRSVAHGLLKRVKATPQQVGRPTCRAPSGCRRRPRARSPAAGCCWSTTCSPPDRRSTPAPVRSCVPVPRRSTCWYSRGLWQRSARPYKV
jgi:predicted amidophosphoribosyltransferase